MNKFKTKGYFSLKLETMICYIKLNMLYMVIKGLDDCGFLIFKRGFGGRDHFTDCRYWSPLEENRDINSIYISGKSYIYI